MKLLTESYPGFKIPRSHYRIGAKLHISDFYFAKRIFQNSFFASKFAFLLVKRMEEVFTEVEIKRFCEEGVSLVGYGLYSELLLSLTEKFWVKKWPMGEGRLNHNLVSDEGDMKLIKSTPLLPHVILIIPIASTFSTALKVEEFIVKGKYTGRVNPNHFNLLHVRDLGPKASDLRKEFKWEEPDNDDRMIFVESLFDKVQKQRREHFFVVLPTHWQSVEKCAHCYPSRFGNGKLVDEECLIETNSTSLVPAVVFSFPTIRRLTEEEDKRTYKFSAGMMKYSVLPNSSGFINYTFNSEEFLNLNRDTVGPWLEGLAATEYNKEDMRSLQTLIISSCHQSNVAFLNLVNELLFSSAANIIHYDPKNDFIENFEVTYGNDINTADRIVFVDDSLKQGSTFLRINDFVSYVLRNKANATSYRKGRATGISDCIILMNKSSPYAEALIKGRLVGSKRIDSFANLHLFPTLPVGDYGYFIEETRKYTRIIQESFLDSLKKYFSQQYAKLLVPIPQGLTRDGEMELKERHLITLEAIHLIYKFLSVKENQPGHNTYVRDFIRMINASASTSFKYEVKYAKPVMGFSPLEMATIKALTQYPLTQYEPLKRISFRWILQLLDEEVKDITKGGILSYERLNYFKFLLGRASQINSNYLLSEEMFEMLVKLLSQESVGALFGDIQRIEADLLKASAENADSEDVRKKAERIRSRLEEQVSEFHVFFAAQIKELLYKNDERAIWLEELLLAFSGIGDRYFSQLIRIMRAENSMLIQNFVESLKEDDAWKKLYSNGERGKDKEEMEEAVNKDILPIRNLFNDSAVINSTRFRKMERFFEQAGQLPASENILFQHYLWLMYFLQYDDKKKKLSLTERTGFICNRIRLIIDSKLNNVPDILNPGVFLVIVDSQQKPFLVYDKNREGKSLVDNDSWERSNPFLGHFIKGVSDEHMSYHETIMELTRDKNDKGWIDMYSVSDDPTIKNLHQDFLPQKMNRLILVRLYKRTADLKTSNMGLLGIYYESNTDALTNVNRVRYLLLLIGQLSNFVERHHQNNEFRDWVIAENTKKLALLSGHGREMLQQLSEVDPRFKTISNHLMHLQTIILLDKEVVNDEENEEDYIKRRFFQFYDVKGKETVRRKDFEEIMEMAQIIYAAAEVENKEELDPVPDLTFGNDEDFQFSFNKNILNLIFFELIINAKKNRWHFVGDKPGNMERNELKMEVELSQTGEGRQLEIRMLNTCPLRKDRDFFRALSSEARNVKDNDATAGTALVKKLVRKILGGRISFEEKKITEEIGYFEVLITLKEMLDEKDHSNY